MHAEEIDHETQTIYLHETVDRYGRLMRGLKGSHHVEDREKRGRRTLLPQQLDDLVESAEDGYLFRSPRGKFWSIRNFYRDVWTPAQTECRSIVHAVRPSAHVRVAAAGGRHPCGRGFGLDGTHDPRRRP